MGGDDSHHQFVADQVSMTRQVYGMKKW